MNEQVFWTILLGVTVYVLGQVFVKFVIDPIQNLYKLIGEVGHSLIYYANLYSNCKRPMTRCDVNHASSSQALMLSRGMASGPGCACCHLTMMYRKPLEN